MKKGLVFAIIVSSLLFLSGQARACEAIPEGYYKYLTLEETINLSTAIILGEKSSQGPAQNNFPFGGEPLWIGIKIKEVLSSDLLGKQEKIKILTSQACGYAGAYPVLEDNLNYLIFLRDKDKEDIFHPVIYNDAYDPHYGITAYEVNNDTIPGLNLTLSELKELLKKITPAPIKENSSCILLGERGRLQQQCCENLTKIPDCFKSGGECACTNCACFYCSSCGNGICESDYEENACNCKSDCKFTFFQKILNFFRKIF